MNIYPLSPLSEDELHDQRLEDQIADGEYPSKPSFDLLAHYEYLASRGATHEQILVTLTDDEIRQLHHMKARTAA